jgi:hypothetical protein
LPPGLFLGRKKAFAIFISSFGVCHAPRPTASQFRLPPKLAAETKRLPFPLDGIHSSAAMAFQGQPRHFSEMGTASFSAIAKNNVLSFSYKK